MVMRVHAVLAAVCALLVAGAARCGAAGSVEFKSYSQNVPPGKRFGIVSMRTSGAAGESDVRLVEITAGIPQWPVEKRAAVVAERLNRAHAAMGDWWRRLAIATAKGDVVLVVNGLRHPDMPRASDGRVYILTADQEFARECGKAPQRLAASLIDDIRAAFRPPAAPTPSQRLRRRAVRDSDAEAVSAAAKLTPEELLNCAVEYRRRGDEEYDEGNVAAALSQYRTAVDLCPSYAVARIRLVDALIEKGNTEEARAQLGELRKLSGLGKTDLAEIARQEKRLR